MDSMARSKAGREVLRTVRSFWVTGRYFTRTTGGDSDRAGGLNGEFLVGNKKGRLGSTTRVRRESEKQRGSGERVGGPEGDTDA